MPTKQAYVNVFHPSKPHEKQEEILRDESLYKLIRCGRKFGKTQLLTSWSMAKAISNECELARLVREGVIPPNEAGEAHARGVCPNKLTFPYVAPTFKQAKNIIWRDHVDKLLTHFKEVGLDYEKNESELSITFPSGGRFQLFGVENEDGLRGISNWGSFVGDEFDDWDQDIMTYIVFPNLTVHEAPLFLAGTPKGESGIHEMEHAQDEEGKKLMTSWHFSSYENPVLPDRALKRLVQWAKAKGEDFYNQEIMADYIKKYGVVYKEFNEKEQVSNLVKYDADLPLHISWDFGVNDPTAIIWIQPDMEGNLRVIDYHEESNASLDYFVSLINSKPYKKAAVHTGDIAARARSLQTGKSVVDELKSRGIYLMTRPIPTIEEQIRKTHEFIPRLRIKKPEKIRVNTGRHEGTARFISVLKNYAYPEEKPVASTSTGGPSEKPRHDQWSHGARALEYYAMNIGYTEDAGADGDFPEFDAIRKDGFYIN